MHTKIMSTKNIYERFIHICYNFPHTYFFFSSIVKVIHLMGIIHFQLSFSLYSIMFTKTYFIQLKEHFMAKRRDIHIYTDTQMYSFISTKKKMKIGNEIIFSLLALN